MKNKLILKVNIVNYFNAFFINRMRESCDKFNEWAEYTSINMILVSTKSTESLKTLCCDHQSLSQMLILNLRLTILKLEISTS